MTDIQGILGEESNYLLEHVCQGIPKDMLHPPGPDFIDRVFMDSDRSPRVMRNLPRR
jgi:class I fructose-bisphosphate aldolase